MNASDLLRSVTIIPERWHILLQYGDVECTPEQAAVTLNSIQVIFSCSGTNSCSSSYLQHIIASLVLCHWLTHFLKLSIDSLSLNIMYQPHYWNLLLALILYLIQSYFLLTIQRPSLCGPNLVTLLWNEPFIPFMPLPAAIFSLFGFVFLILFQLSWSYLL